MTWSHLRRVCYITAGVIPDPNLGEKPDNLFTCLIITGTYYWAWVEHCVSPFTPRPLARRG